MHIQQQLESGTVKVGSKKYIRVYWTQNARFFFFLFPFGIAEAGSYLFGMNQLQIERN